MDTFYPGQGQLRVKSVHAEMQPDVYIVPRSEARKCQLCRARSIYWLDGRPLCRRHAAQAQEVINRLRAANNIVWGS